MAYLYGTRGNGGNGDAVLISARLPTSADTAVIRPVQANDRPYSGIIILVLETLHCKYAPTLTAHNRTR